MRYLQYRLVLSYASGDCYQTMMRMLHVTLTLSAAKGKGLDGLGIRDSSLRSE